MPSPLEKDWRPDANATGQPGPTSLSSPVCAYGSFGRWRDCVARFAIVQTGAGREPDYKAAVCYAHVGNNVLARRMLTQLETAARKRYVDHTNIAEIYVALGEKDAAFKALEQACNDRSQPLALLSSNPEFGPVHDDARYQALVERLCAGLNLTGGVRTFDAFRALAEG